MTKSKAKNAPVKKGEQREIHIDSIAPGGKGVGKIDGFPIFLERTAVGDIVEAHIYDVRKSFALASIKRLIKPSEDRVEPVCSYFKHCGGCQWQHLSYEAQLKAKKEIVIQAVERIGGLSKDLIRDPIGANSIGEHQLRYRNKVQFPVRESQGSEKKLEIGYYEKNSHNLVNIETCPVQPESIDSILAEVRNILDKHQVEAYDETEHKGLLRHLLIRESDKSKDVLVTLVLNLGDGNSFLDLEKQFQKIADEVTALSKVCGFCINFNARKGNKILGDQTVCLKGNPEIVETLVSDRKQISFNLSTNSFFQIHSKQATVLLEQIHTSIEEFSTKSKPIIVDAYAGVGTIALWLAESAEKVIAIEENPFAVADGIKNAKVNNISNLEFIEGRSEKCLKDLQKSDTKIDILVLDPPRKGLSQSVVESVLKLAPPLIIYVSCNPSTLARDLQILEVGLESEEHEKVGHSGYKTLRVTPIDMFPQTYHVESIACLKKRSS